MKKIFTERALALMSTFVLITIIFFLSVGSATPSAWRMPGPALPIDMRGKDILNSGVIVGLHPRFPVLGSDPLSPVDGDVWIKNQDGTRSICARIGGSTYCATLTVETPDAGADSPS